MVKAPRVASVLISLGSYKRVRDWFQLWLYHHLSPLSNSLTIAPQDHSGITGVLRDITTWLQNVESLRSVIVAQHEVDQEMRVLDHFPSTSQLFVLDFSASNGLTVPLAYPLYNHQFVNAHTETAIQAYFTLTYAGHNIYLTTLFLQDLLQLHIMVILILVLPQECLPTSLPQHQPAQQTLSKCAVNKQKIHSNPQQPAETQSNPKQPEATRDVGSGPSFHWSMPDI